MSDLATVTWLEGSHRICRTGWIRQDTRRVYIRNGVVWQILCYTDDLININYHRKATR